MSVTPTSKGRLGQKLGTGQETTGPKTRGEFQRRADRPAIVQTRGDRGEDWKLLGGIEQGGPVAKHSARQGEKPECSKEDGKLLGGIEQGWPVAKHSARQGEKPECSEGVHLTSSWRY